MTMEPRTAKMLKYLFLLTRLKKKTRTTTSSETGQKFAALNWIAVGASEKPIAMMVGPMTTGVIILRMRPMSRP